MTKLAVLAIGGNSLIKDKQHETVEDQYNAVCETAKHIAGMVEQGYDVVVTHGNGPQVGFILRRSEIAHQIAGMHLVPLVNCGADTQGAIGYQIQQSLYNEFKRRGIKKNAATVVTQVVVDKNDLAFQNPTKPIGTFYTKERAEELQKEHPDWVIINDAGRGYRRVVPSPMPVEIVEQEAIKMLVKNGFSVVGVGGGGIPVIRKDDGTLEGVDAVIDKDNASSLLAINIKADVFIISTAVEKVYLNFNQPNQIALDRLTVVEAKKYIEEGHFAKGSMLPKIQAIIRFLEAGGKEAIVTNPESLEKALKGETGTHIYS
ncbi:MAG TPA: carbamate kinase [Candidatus Atribacteria bacterium]|nr:carbamate kinase [Candidatus Atribacteria bacterium]